MKKDIKQFNIIVTGVGGQGAVTMTRIISKASALSGFDSVASEVHGLAQRGGHVACHVKFGEKIHSPLVKQADADLIISTEPLEILRVMHYVSKKTAVIADTHKIIPISVSTDKKPYPTLDYVKKQAKLFTKKIYFCDATADLKENLKTTVPLNIYMLGFAYYKDLLPIKKEKLLQAIRNSFDSKYYLNNKKAFELAFK